MTIIYADNINEFLLENFNQYDEAIILGKGPTFQPVEFSKPNIFVIGINDTINHSDHVDMLTANDIEMYDKIDNEKIKKIKYILIPKNIHKGRGFHPEISYLNVLTKIENDFNGDMIVYNLQTSPVDDRYITLRTRASSGNSAADFIGAHLKNIKKVTLFGIAKDCGYANIFKGEPIEEIYTEEKMKHFQSLFLDSLEGREVVFK